MTEMIVRQNSSERPRAVRAAVVGGVVIAATLLAGCTFPRNWQFPEIEIPGVPDTVSVGTSHYQDASVPEAAVKSQPDLVNGHMDNMDPESRRIVAVSPVG